MWPYPWTHVGTPSHLGHMDRVAATMPSQAHAGAAQEAPDIGQWEGQVVPLVRPSSCNVKGGIPSSRRYLPTYLPPRSSRACTPECEELSLCTERRPRTMNKLGHSGSVDSKLTPPIVEFSSGLVWLVEYNSCRGRPPPGLQKCLLGRGMSLFTLGG